MVNAPAGPAPDASTIRRSIGTTLVDRFGHDDGKQILASLVTATRADLNLLRQSIEAVDRDGVGHALHRITGAFGTIGLSDSVDHVRQAEAMIETEEIARYAPHLYGVLDSMETLLSSMAEELASLG